MKVGIGRFVEAGRGGWAGEGSGGLGRGARGWSRVPQKL